MSTPRERPIIFAGESVRAILDGRKSEQDAVEHVLAAVEALRLSNAKRSP